MGEWNLNAMPFNSSNFPAIIWFWIHALSGLKWYILVSPEMNRLKEIQILSISSRDDWINLYLFWLYAIGHEQIESQASPRKEVNFFQSNIQLNHPGIPLASPLEYCEPVEALHPTSFCWDLDNYVLESTPGQVVF